MEGLAGRVNEKIGAALYDAGLFPGRETWRSFLHISAMWSHGLAQIHPFPDFNGRLSRIMMNTALHYAPVGPPFFLSLRSDKKGRHRYLRAMQAGDKGDLRPLETLIGMSLIERFEALHQQLRLANLEPFLA